MKPIAFPAGFYWGGATSSHQVEGRNTNNDWFVFEQLHGKIADGTVSGDACDHYSRFREDFALLKGLNHNAHRFSVEWSRVEPAPGYFSRAALDHYRDMAAALRENGMEPFVTLHHFGTPLWLAKKGGWSTPEAVERFVIYAGVVVSALGNDVTFWMPINEPMIYSYMGYILGTHAPGRRSLLKGFRVASHMLLAHALTYRKIKEHNSDAQVGFNRHLRVFDPHRSENRRDISAARRQAKNFNWDMLDALHDGGSHGLITVSRKDRDTVAGAYDFLGLNYYSRDQVMFSLSTPFQLFGATIVPPGAETSHQGEGEYYPHGICRLLHELERYEKPLFVTENGVATEDDAYRVKYMGQHIAEVGRAIQDGSDVRGYLFWSTLDNFEWAEGYTMRFGMIHVDFDTQERTVKPSGKMFAEIAKNNRIDHPLVKAYGATL